MEAAHFSNELWQATGNRPFTTTSSGKGHRSSEVNCHWSLRSPVYIRKRSRSAPGGIGRESCTMSYYRTTSSSIRTKYCSRPDELKAKIGKKRPQLVGRKGIVFFHHDNARFHASLRTWQKLPEFGRDVLPHPPYSPFTYSTLQLLLIPVRNSTPLMKLWTLERPKNSLNRFSVEETQDLYEGGIMKLFGRWKNFVQRCIYYGLKLFLTKKICHLNFTWKSSRTSPRIIQYFSWEGLL